MEKDDLILRNGSPPPPSTTLCSSSLSFSVDNHPQYQNRWCLPGNEETSADDCCDTEMVAGKRPCIFKLLETVKGSRKERNQGSSCTEEDDINGSMDQKIWQQFPQDLFEVVISRLPIATFFKFRTVCLKWNALIYSDSFSRCCNELPQTIPWFYTVSHKNFNLGQVYDPSLNKWHYQIIPAAAPDNPTTIYLPMASAGGLVCFLRFGYENIYVSNPLTKAFRELPTGSFGFRSRCGIGMTMNGNSTSHGYKVLCVGCEGQYEVFDSLSNVWTIRGTLPSNIQLPISLNFNSQPVAIHNVVNFMLTEGILSYDMVSGKWKQFMIPDPPDLSNQMLVGCGERLMLVGLLSNTWICIWELQKMTLLWKEVDRMPNTWSSEFHKKDYWMKGVGSKGYLIFVSLWSKQMSRLITYNAVTREWTKLPDCTFPRPKKELKIFPYTCGTPFYPSPTARP